MNNYEIFSLLVSFFFFYLLIQSLLFSFFKGLSDFLVIFFSFFFGLFDSFGNRSKEDKKNWKKVSFFFSNQNKLKGSLAIK